MLIPILKLLKIGSTVFPVNPRNLNSYMTAWDLCKMVEPPSPKMLDEMIQWLNEKKWTMLNGQLNILEHLPELDIPLLLFYAPDDPFVNLDTAKDFFNSLKTTDKEMYVLSKELGCQHDYNHCDLAFGENGETEVFEPIKLWLEKHIDYINPVNIEEQISKPTKNQTKKTSSIKKENKTVSSDKTPKKISKNKSNKTTVIKTKGET